MKILGIETSCDETAVCVVEANGGFTEPSFKILGDALYSQIKIHAEYGGVFPSLAKREHSKNLPHLLKKALEDAGQWEQDELPANRRSSLSQAGVPQGASLFKGQLTPASHKQSGIHIAPKLDTALLNKLEKILEREPGLFEGLKEILETTELPAIDAIAVTAGPGLEPALWVGINFARALGVAWNIPVYPSNHMEGHIVSPLLFQAVPAGRLGGGQGVVFPALALLISGGHTELVLIKDWLTYEVIGGTLDDAIGEAFDKVARLLSLPYPGGPQISKLAEEARNSSSSSKIGGGVKLPRPMLKTPDYNFSFSGIKTAVLYHIKKKYGEVPIPDQDKKEIALEFENAVTEVLVKKTERAIEQYGIRTLILGGGVVANTHIRNSFKKLVHGYPEVKLLVPNISHSTDNAVMIAAAGYFNIIAGAKHQEEITAKGNLHL